MLTTWEDIYRKVYGDYLNDDVELSGEFFNFEVSAPKSELMLAYAELLETINCDTVIHLRDAIEIPSINNSNVSAYGWESDDVNEFMSEVYTGNMKAFLESFDGRERETGWYRFSDYGPGIGGLTGGTKQCFVL